MDPSAFDFALPPEQIAQVPAARRGDARMLVLDGDARHDRIARELPLWVPAGALVVVNDSRVVPARVAAVRVGDGRSFELLFTAPQPGLGPGTHTVAWVRPGRKLAPGDVLAVGDALQLRALPAAAAGRERGFEVVAGDVLDACRRHGAAPLPPYIRRPSGPVADDAARYQTVYAAAEGSVAAPTAGLHLEPQVLAALDVVSIALHVGPGTFLPMDVPDVTLHRVGAERLIIAEAAATRIEQARRERRPIVAVGTTVVRALESVAKLCGAIEPGARSTELVVTPGFRFEVVTHLLTNFHLPRSSLLMLVCSFGGHARVLAAYADAVARGYRFYSYGDCMFLGAA
ncbi:MAG: tRNA preQ1(34) S-adenosylmethionine ribosyltransferase-isomerase QueA [Nannocystaceae bacterium]|nr:tRNA preQ1(34) S-adenosylmethionine ribosyltransferase-isomerase QueA [Nannocystaceae bacterium]